MEKDNIKIDIKEIMLFLDLILHYNFFTITLGKAEFVENIMKLFSLKYN
jgi:hypothetical protein